MIFLNPFSLIAIRQRCRRSATLLRKDEPAPEDALAKEMTHDLEMNFNKIAPSATCLGPERNSRAAIYLSAK